MNPVVVQLNLIDPPPLAFEPTRVNGFLNDSIPPGRIGDRIPVVTSEALSGNMFCGGYNGKELSDRLRQVFPEGRILIIVREQRTMLRSLYSSFISWGMPHSIDRYLNPVDGRKVPQYNPSYLQYDRLVTYYFRLFGERNVLVLCFEQFAENPKRFVRSICDFSKNAAFSQNALDSLPFDKRVNKGRILMNLMLQRWLNYFFVANGFNYSGLFKDTSATARKRLNACKRRNDLFPRFMHNWFEKTFEKKIIEKTKGLFGESNRNLSQIMKVDLASYGYDVQ